MEALIVAAAILFQWQHPERLDNGAELDPARIEQTELWWSGCTDGQLNLNAQGVPYEPPIFALGNNHAVVGELTPGRRCIKARTYVDGIAGHWSDVLELRVPSVPTSPKEPPIIVFEFSL